MNCKKVMMLNIGLGLCLVTEAVVYEPFAGVNNTLPSDRTFEENFGYKADFINPSIGVGAMAPMSVDQRTIGGGAVDYCPYCGAALDPHDHTELIRHGGNGNAYDYTGRPHNCQMPLDGEEVLLWLVALLFGARWTHAFWRKRAVKHAQDHGSPCWRGSCRRLPLRERGCLDHR